MHWAKTTGNLGGDLGLSGKGPPNSNTGFQLTVHLPQDINENRSPAGTQRVSFLWLDSWLVSNKNPCKPGHRLLLSPTNKDSTTPNPPSAFPHLLCFKDFWETPPRAGTVSPSNLKLAYSSCQHASHWLANMLDTPFCINTNLSHFQGHSPLSRMKFGIK